MKIWKLKVDFGPNEEYEDIQLVNMNEDFTEAFDEAFYCGERTKGEFNNVEVKVIGGQVESDYTKLWNAEESLVLSKRALVVLEDLLKDNCEIIKLKCKSRMFFAVNILNPINALNYDNSKLKRLRSGLVVDVDEYIFLEEKIKGKNIFRIFLEGIVMVSEIFVSENFKKIVEDNNLKGFKFEEVWSTKK